MAEQSRHALPNTHRVNVTALRSYKYITKMAGGDSHELCAMCKKVIKNTETVLVCGLWCRKSFHNKCLGITNSEARAVTCTKLRIKFHCEACEKRLGVELFGEKEPQEPKNVETCVNNCVNLLNLVQKLVKLTTEVSNDNSAINSKLDNILSSNAKLEEYLLQSQKRFEKQSEEARDSTVCVESDSPKRITEIRGQYDSNIPNQNINNKQMSWCASEIQQTDNSLLSIGSDFPEQSADSQHPSQQQNIVEDCSSNCQQDREEPDGHDSSEESLSIIKEECSLSEDFKVISTLIAEKREDEEDQERAVIEAGMKRRSSSEDVLGPSTFSTENTEDDEVEEAVKDNNFEVVKHEVELTTAGSERERSIPVGMEGSKSDDGSGGLVANVSLAARKEKRIRHSMNLEPEAYGNKTGERYLGHKCDVCNKTFVQFQELQEHKHEHRHKVVHSCSVCHKTFKRSSNLKVHIRCHTGERPYVRSICNKTFTQSSDVREHLRVHTGEPPYRCSICNKAFTQTSSMRVHKRLHTGERPYECSVCGKAFTHNTTLKCHLMLHTGERPYSCGVCTKSFIRKSQQKWHSRLHRGQFPYRCSVCNKTFSQDSELKQHSQVHVDKFPYSCEKCHERFRSIRYLKKHLRLHIGMTVQLQNRSKNSRREVTRANP